MSVPGSPDPGPVANGSATVTAGTAPYVMRPTRCTCFLRTFVPWQAWRFARINLKVIGIVRGPQSGGDPGTGTAGRGHRGAAGVTAARRSPRPSARREPVCPWIAPGCPA